MDILGVPFTVIDWSKVPANEHKGETGVAHWHDIEMGNIHVHLAEYSPGYKAADWCSMGHVLLVMKGQLITELKDGREFVINAGESYQVSSSETNPHRSRTETGVTLFVVD